MPQQWLQEILHDDNLRKFFGLPPDYDESQAEDLMNLSDEDLESTKKILAFREYLIANAPPPTPEVAPHLKVAPVTPPPDDDDRDIFFILIPAWLGSLGHARHDKTCI